MNLDYYLSPAMAKCDNLYKEAFIAHEYMMKRCFGPCPLLHSLSVDLKLNFDDFLDFSYTKKWPLDWRLHIYFLVYLFTNWKDFLNEKIVIEALSSAVSQWTYCDKSSDKIIYAQSKWFCGSIRAEKMKDFKKDKRIYYSSSEPLSGEKYLAHLQQTEYVGGGFGLEYKFE